MNDLYSGSRLFAAEDSLVARDPGEPRAGLANREVCLTRFSSIRNVPQLGFRRVLMWGYSSAGRAQHWQC